MYSVRIIKTNKNREKNQLLTFRLYHDFRHAFSDIIDKDSEINRYLNDIGYKHDPERIQQLTFFSEDTVDGYGDDFEFRYWDGITITLGKALITDDDTNNFKKE